MRYVESVIDLVGNTPLVRLNSVAKGIEATVLAKVEYVNPGGSVKDRMETIERIITDQPHRLAQEIDSLSLIDGGKKS